MGDQVHAFRVRGLDCIEEIKTIRSALLSLGYSESDLAFDLLRGKLSVLAQGSDEEEKAICVAVGKAGLEATGWSEFALRQGEDERFWSLHGRFLLCVAGGVLNAGALLWHGVQHGWSDAFGGVGEEHGYPVASLVTIGVAVVIGFWFVIPKVWYALRRGRADMNLLMLVAVLGAMFLGEWMEEGMVAFLFSVSLQLEAWSVRRARRSISALLATTPDTAWVFCNHALEFERRAAKEVNIGSRVQVRPGERIPLDGEVTLGESYVNQSPITGESMPIPVSLGSMLYAGSVNGNATIEMTVTQLAEDSTLSRMIALVEDAHSKRSEREVWVERFAGIYTPTVMVLSALVMVSIPLFNGGNWLAGVYQGLVLLVIACPCALVLSAPITIVSALSAAAGNGVLIKGGTVLDRAARIDTLATDKTGTLTLGNAAVQTVLPLNGHTREEVLARAAAMESQSDHPIATAILAEARAEKIDIPKCDSYRIVQGKGATGQFNGRMFWIGSNRFAQERGVDEELVRENCDRLVEMGDTVVVVGHEEHACGLIGVADEIRTQASEMVELLHACGVASVMLTGDGQGPATSVAEAVGVDSVEYGLLPEEKVEAVSALTREGRHVAMLGDGINDDPAMAAASLGIAMGAMGSDAAIETADVALVSDDLLKVPWLIEHAKRTMRILKQNIGFALGVKAAFVLLAVVGISTLWMAIIADMGASLLVIFNGLRLLHTKI